MAVPAIPQPRKLLHLQILRAVAASMVVVNHAIRALTFRHLPCMQYEKPADLIGNSGVVAFFVLSGLIMTRQSAGQFGSARSALYFMQHRLIRIVPMYWLATGAWMLQLWYWHVPTPHARQQMLLSLAFVPDYLAGNGLMQPILQVGWTLDYEMFFYLLFAGCLLLPRRYGIALLLGLLSLLTMAGPRFADRGTLPGFYTSPLLLLFAAGAAIAFCEIQLPRMPTFNLPVSPALLLLLVPVLALAYPMSSQAGVLWIYIRWLGIAVVLLCTFARLDRPSWIHRLLILLGDASYSTYLVHLWAIDLVLPLELQAYARLHLSLRPPWIFLLGCVVAANGLGLLVHVAVERPLTDFLRRRVGPRRRAATLLVAA